MKLEYRRGDLFKGPERAIAHGCNALGKMGKGFAKALADTYPEAAQIYLDQPGYTLGQVIPWIGPDRIVLHLITQEKIQRKGEPRQRWVSYDAVRAAFAMIERGAARHLARQEGFFFDQPRLAIPKIGSDLGGGDWKEIEAIIEQEIASIQVVVYEL
ncbi:macro domain protein (plasmid) [Bosea sp. RAC05]|nr:macro domain protein [Bosea sp. RAC05]